MSDNTCNGWSNYPTWAAALWLDNEESTYNYIREQIAGLKEDESDPTELNYSLQQVLKDLIEESAPELEASLYSDLLTFALEQINYYEIAKNMLED